MRKVKIIQGVYGFAEENKVIPKTRKDSPFSLEDEKAEKIVKLGIAEYAEELSENLEDMDLQRLKKLAKEKGVKVTGTKEEIMERIKQEECLELEAVEPE